MLGSLAVWWTHDLVSPASGWATPEATRSGAPSLVEVGASQPSGLQTTNPPAPTQQSAPPASTSTRSNNPPAPSPLGAGLQAASTISPIEPASIGTLPSPPLTPVQPQSATRDVSPATAMPPGQGQNQSQSQENSSAAPFAQPASSSRPQQSTAASINGGPLNPIHPPRSAPVVALPATGPMAWEDKARAIQLPLRPGAETMASDNNKSGRQRPHGRPRGARGNNQPGSPDASLKMWRRNMRGRQGQTPFSPQQ